MVENVPYYSVVILKKKIKHTGLLSNSKRQDYSLLLKNINIRKLYMITGFFSSVKKLSKHFKHRTIYAFYTPRIFELFLLSR